MKITISTSDRRFTLNGTEDQCKQLFSSLVSRIISETPAPETVPHFISSIKSEIAAPKYLTGVRGFLYVRCPKCGKEHGFCTKSPITESTCKDCGEKFQLPEKMTPVEFTCECGHSFKYLTNITDAEFDIPCMDCGTPNAVMFHKIDNRYKDARRIKNA